MDNDKKTRKPKKTSAVNWSWITTITMISLLLSIVMSYVSNEVMNRVSVVISFAVLLLIIALGVLFDMIGVAATAATEKEFHSMAARKVRGAREAVWMTRNAGKVSSICCDVIGDICGIVSGATGALIVARISVGFSAGLTLLASLLIAGFISAMTIGGKAAGKGIAIAYNGRILAVCGAILAILPIVPDKKK